MKGMNNLIVQNKWMNERKKSNIIKLINYLIYLLSNI